ncbi:MAG: hypothetical protein E7376_03920 [Clostridiales bacterium]|nr:hypothetical protein [Clostridiales bacterium]
MTNTEFIQNLGIELTGDILQDNLLINELFKVGTSDKFVKFVKVGEKYKKFTLSPISFEIGFTEQIWSQLSIAEKLRLMKWASEDYLQRNLNTTNFPNFIYFTENSYEHISFIAFALKDKILISLNDILKCSGYDAYILAVHESIHEKDYIFAEKLIDEVLCNYIQNYSPEKDYLTLKSIMQLPVEGKILNVKTGEFEFVTNELKEQILLCKNRIITICKLKNTPKSRNFILTPTDFNKYLTSDFYYLSPLETRAYNDSISHVLQVAEENSKILTCTNADRLRLEKNNKYLKTINGRKREIQKQFKIPADFAVNMELEYIFNKLNYGNNQEKYICKKHMKQREECIKRFWILKHGTKGEYEATK